MVLVNHEIILVSRAPNNDYSPETLQTVNDVVYLNLFDEMIFNISQVGCQLCFVVRDASELLCFTVVPQSLSLHVI